MYILDPHSTIHTPHAWARTHNGVHLVRPDRPCQLVHSSRGHSYCSLLAVPLMALFPSTKSHIAFIISPPCPSIGLSYTATEHVSLRWAWPSSHSELDRTESPTYVRISSLRVECNGYVKFEPAMYGTGLIYCRERSHTDTAQSRQKLQSHVPAMR